MVFYQFIMINLPTSGVNLLGTRTPGACAQRTHAATSVVGHGSAVLARAEPKIHGGEQGFHHETWGFDHSKA